MKKFDPKVFFGVCMGSGSVLGMAMKTYITFEGGTSPFWLWAALGFVLFLSIVVVIRARRDRAELRGRIERSSQGTARKHERWDDDGVESLEEMEDRRRP